MVFKLTNPQIGLSSHGDVLEFTAEEGTCTLPFWVFPMQLMRHLGIEEASDVTIEQVQLPRGLFVKLQPHETAFIDLPNPKAVLENALRKYACLTKGDSIVIEFAGRQYEIDIVETRPGDAILTIQTDLEVDFAPPRDYQSSPELKKEPSLTFNPEQVARKDSDHTWESGGYRLDGRKASFNEPKEEEKKPEYDPRKHRLTNGVRANQNNMRHNYWDSLGKGNSLK